MVGTCWRPCSVDDTRGKFDGLLWSKDSGNHLYGQFSMAVVQANYELEDRSQVESGHLSSTSSGPQGTFIGVYDGHGGAEAASFITQHLFSNLNWIVSEHEGVSEKAIKKAFAATEDDFLSFVKKQWLAKPNMASVGSCCLAGILCNGLLYIANAGDSRAVLGTVESGTREIRAIQLSKEHNATIESVRDELRSLHPNDPDIVVQKNDAWRVKGIIQVSRSIGDAYLKRTEFNKEPLPSKYRLPKPFQEPILGPEPEISVHRIRPEDKFLIFASDGLWECLSNQEAVNIVRNSPRHGIAKRLVKAAIKKAAKNKEIRYSDLLKIEQGVRRHFHDDITVVVVFIDSRSGNRGSVSKFRFGWPKMEGKSS